MQLQLKNVLSIFNNYNPVNLLFKQGILICLTLQKIHKKNHPKRVVFKSSFN